MSKQQKSNKESKKPKATPEEGKKQKKDPKRYDGSIAGLFGHQK
ncbi:MAG TPA: hypothetical protein V6C78_18635 [Crinalium sp.]|jgi:hypothetical protein